MNTLTFNGIDIGQPRMSGITTQNAAGVTVIAGGEDIWGSRDEFHFASILVSGDFEIQAQVASLEMADLYTKGGIMVRTTLDAGAPHAMLLAFGDNQPRNNNNGGLEFQYRTGSNTACAGIYPPQPLPGAPDFPASFPNVWLRLARRGNVISGCYGNDGVAWRNFCNHGQSLPHSLYAGLAVTSHNVGKTVKAEFRNVSIKM